MTTLLRKAATSFIRSMLPIARSTADELPKLPRFEAVAGRRPGSTRFEETTQPNWWQISSLEHSPLNQTAAAVQLTNLLAATEPFRNALGKAVVTPGITTTYQTSDIAKLLLVSYLYLVPSLRWNPRVFARVWNGLERYFDEDKPEIQYSLFAPIYGLPSLRRTLSIDAELAIAKIRGNQLADLASQEPQLAGVVTMPRLSQWTSSFLVANFSLRKRIVADTWERPDGEGPFTALEMLPEAKPYDYWFSRINEEVAYFRAFLSTEIFIPTYAIIRADPPLEPGGGAIPPQLPWRPTPVIGTTSSQSAEQIHQYKKLRSHFRSLEGQKGWADILASMRRHALAWENPFQADRLADLVAALERLIVGDDSTEVGYKLRVRTAHWLADSHDERRAIAEDIREAYGYRSGVAHGGYIPDHFSDFETAQRMGLKRSGKKHPVRVASRIQKLTRKVSEYYRRALLQCTSRSSLVVDWADIGL